MGGGGGGTDIISKLLTDKKYFSKLVCVHARICVCLCLCVYMYVEFLSVLCFFTTSFFLHT